MEEYKKFAFLMHPRNIRDIVNVYPILKLVPSKVIKFLITFLNPLVLGRVNIILDNNIIEGFLIGIFLTADQMLSLPKSFVQKKIVKSLFLADSLDVGIVGLGGLTSPITNGGVDLLGKFHTGITTGNAFTVSTSLDGLIDILRRKNLNPSLMNFCIVGATGSIGQGISKKIAQITPSLLLIGRTFNHLIELEKNIIEINPLTRVIISTNIEDIKESDVVIVATTSSEALITPDILKRGAIVYDIAQPKNVSKEVIKKRQDVLVVDGGLVEVPNININFNLFLPPLTIYGCLAETILLAAERKYYNYSIGKVTLEKIDEINQIGKKYNFKHKILYNKISS